MKNQEAVEAVPGRPGKDSLLVGLCSRVLATRRGLRRTRQMPIIVNECSPGYKKSRLHQDQLRQLMHT